MCLTPNCYSRERIYILCFHNFTEQSLHSDKEGDLSPAPIKLIPGMPTSLSAGVTAEMFKLCVWTLLQCEQALLAAWACQEWGVSTRGQNQILRHNQLQQKLLVVCHHVEDSKSTGHPNRDFEVYNSELQGQSRSSAVLSCTKIYLRHIIVYPKQKYPELAQI